MCGQGTLPVPQPLGEGEGEATAGRVTGQHDLAVLGMPPLKGGAGIVDGRRVGVLGSQPVVRDKGGAAGGAGQACRQLPVAARRVRDIGAAVQVDKDVIAVGPGVANRSAGTPPASARSTSTSCGAG
ncbi:MAG: hypothetical protein NVSMB55_09810 [Mycobacteriales bacterium]